MIPDFLKHLPTHGDYPVPYTVMWIDGKPDFRVVDPKKLAACLREMTPLSKTRHAVAERKGLGILSQKERD